jgi:hypothetical protein
MLSHIVLHVHRSCGRAALVAIAIAALLGCAGSSPQVHVLGVAPAADRAGTTADGRIVVFLEVVNRTGRELELARLEYRLQAPAWFDAEGKLPLQRHVDAASSVVVEVPVEVVRAAEVPDSLTGEEDVDYQLEGRIVAREDRQERSWTVRSSGRLRATQSGVTGGLVRVHVAAGDSP